MSRYFGINLDSDNPVYAAAQPSSRGSCMTTDKAHLMSEQNEGREPVAWRWQTSYTQPDWHYAEKVSFAPHDIERGFVKNVTPLYARPAEAVVTDAWVMVPREPTEAMIEAHFAAHAKAKTVFADVPTIWSAMLDAAPAHNSEEAGE